MQIRVPRGLRVDLCGMQKTSRNSRTIHVFNERAKLQFRHLKRMYRPRVMTKRIGSIRPPGSASRCDIQNSYMIAPFPATLRQMTL